MNKLDLRTIKAGISATLMAAVSIPSVFAQETDGGGDQVIEEVLVTALKRGAQTQVETAASVSVISSDDIEKLGADSLTDFLQNSAGTSIDSSGAGQTTIQIRGVNTTFGSAAVGFYLDDLPFSFIYLNLLPDPAPFDLDRVEVLKGPQGTLYGAGSAGGVVRVLTKDPVLGELQAKLDANASETEGGGSNYNFSAAFNAPLMADRLALRGSISRQENSGWVDDALGAASDINDEERLNGLLKLLAKPIDEFTIKLMANFSRIDADAAPIADDSGRVPLVIPQSTGGDYDQFGAVVEYEFPGFTLTNATGYLDYENEDEQIPFPLPLIAETTAETFSNELRAYSTHGGPISWTGGLFYRDSDQLVFQDASAFSPNNVDDRSTSTQYSVFGEMTLALFDGYMDVTGGGSYFWDEVERIANANLAPLIPVAATQRTHLFSPRVNVAIHPTDSSTVYFNYAEGFRSGFILGGLSLAGAVAAGVDSDGSVRAETHRAYELGAKGEFFDGALYLEAALFQSNIDDIQQSSAVFVPGVTIPVNIALNSGPARSRGVELLARWTASRAFALAFSGSYTQAEIEKDFNDPGAPPGFPPLFTAGTPLNLVPEVLVNGSASYEWDLGVAGLHATLNGSVQYASERYLSVLAAPPVPGDATTRAGLRFDIGRDDWSVYAFGDNLTNEQGVISPSIISPFFTNTGFPVDRLLGTRLRPRTFGLGVQVEF